MPKHKHADLIIAWANGAEIEIKIDDYWYICNPMWNEDREYRIKPERVWPVSTMTDAELSALWREVNYCAPKIALRGVANAIIKRYIEDNEK